VKLNTNVKVEKNEDESYAKFIMEPLDKGYGVTLGNSIRRVLLSSLEGAAITAIRIEGIDHEFGTIEGIKEDIVNIILNLKRIRLRSFADGPKKIFLKASKKGVVLAKDITVDADVEIVNKKQKICTITGSSVNLEIDIRVERGSGYQLSVANHYEDMPVGTIPVDSTFSPVVKVNHLVVDTRVGTRTDLDKLTLEVTTDGTITAEDALEEASKIVIDSFSLFTDYKHIIPQVVVEPKEQDSGQPSVDLDLTIEDLELSARSSNCLRKAGIVNVAELIEKPMKELMKIKNFGKKSADEINEKLEQYGLKLDGDKWE
jgi:DNA-directed RNA polymerase subunit alpha